jgi:hypothetical protein
MGETQYTFTFKTCDDCSFPLKKHRQPYICYQVQYICYQVQCNLAVVMYTKTSLHLKRDGMLSRLRFSYVCLSPSTAHTQYTIQSPNTTDPQPIKMKVTSYCTSSALLHHHGFLIQNPVSVNTTNSQMVEHWWNIGVTPQYTS